MEDKKDNELILTTCTFCGEDKLRRYIKTKGKEKIYRDENNKLWSGNKCPACKTKAHTEYMRKKRKVDLTPRHCINCGTEFTPKLSKQKYCSDNCRVKYFAKKKKALKVKS